MMLVTKRLRLPAKLLLIAIVLVALAYAVFVGIALKSEGSLVRHWGAWAEPACVGEQPANPLSAAICHEVPPTTHTYYSYVYPMWGTQPQEPVYGGRTPDDNYLYLPLDLGASLLVSVGGIWMLVKNRAKN